MPGIKDKYQISLKVIVENSAGEVLILKCVPNSRMGRGGFYDLPGGRIDTDEFAVNFSDILQREIVEELGNVRITIVDTPVALGRHLIPADPGHERPEIHVLYVFFKGQFQSGDIQISNEHAGYEWVKLNEIDLEKHFTSGILEGVKMYLGK